MRSTFRKSRKNPEKPDTDKSVTNKTVMVKPDAAKPHPDKWKPKGTNTLKSFFFKCNFKDCNRSYRYEHNLVAHQKVHFLFDFLCEFCGKGFFQKASFFNHLNVHNGIYPFECKLCNKGFRAKNRLRDHMKHKHNL